MEDLTTSACGDLKQRAGGSDGCCCTPAADREESAATKALSAASAPISERKASSAVAKPASAIISLPGGTFLMGTNYANGFPQDGEGPVREVALSAFEIDAFPVTNEEFAAFVDATGYRTEAEQFGWSFVFWAHIPEERR